MQKNFRKKQDVKAVGSSDVLGDLCRLLHTIENSKGMIRNTLIEKTGGVYAFERLKFWAAELNQDSPKNLARLYPWLTQSLVHAKESMKNQFPPVTPSNTRNACRVDNSQCFV